MSLSGAFLGLRRIRDRWSGGVVTRLGLWMMIDDDDDGD